MPQTATCYHNSLTLKRTVVHHVQELVFVPARTFDACVGLPLSSLHFFRLVSHALKVMMQTNVSQASRQARSCQTSFSGAELPCNYITRPPKGFRIETRRERSAGRDFPFFSVISSRWKHCGFFLQIRANRGGLINRATKLSKDNMHTLVIRLLQDLSPRFWRYRKLMKVR